MHFDHVIRKLTQGPGFPIANMLQLPITRGLKSTIKKKKHYSRKCVNIGNYALLNQKNGALRGPGEPFRP